MTRRQSFFGYAALLIGVTAFASSFARPSTGQFGVPAAAGEGRYRVSAIPGAGGRHAVFVIDSATGRTWYHDTNAPGATWTDLGTPVPVK